MKRVGPIAEERLELERIAFARKLDGLQQIDGDQIIYMDQTTFMIWPRPAKTWQLAPSTIAAPQNLKYLSAVTLFGAVGKPLIGGKLYMIAPTTDITHVKKFLVKLAASLRNPYGRRPYLFLDNHAAHHSHQVREERDRFIACFQPAYSSPFNCQETIWAQLKREYFVRLYRRDEDLRNDAEFAAMIEQLTQDVPINVDNILRANHRYIAEYLALGAEQQSSDSF